MRIITGLYKGKHFEIPRTFKARPTTDFAKENLFNVLRAYLDFEDLKALDLSGVQGASPWNSSLEDANMSPQLRRIASISPLSLSV